MKKLIITATVVLSAALCGCGSADNTASSSSQNVNVLQKSAEVRQQVQDAKDAAAAAQTANTATGAGASVKDTAKDIANSVAQPVVDEYNAWKDAVGK